MTQTTKHQDKDPAIEDTAGSLSCSAEGDLAADQIITNESFGQGLCSNSDVNCELEFNPFECTQAAIKQQAKHNGRKIMLICLVFLLGFRTIFGPLALTAMLMWLAIVFILTKLQRLNAEYTFAAIEDGVVITRKHWLGKESLKLAWDKFESVQQTELEDGSRKLSLRLHKGVLKLTDRILFQDIFESPELLTLKAAQPESSVFDKLALVCPTDIYIDRSDSGESSNFLAQDPNCYEVPYFPMYQTQKKLSVALRQLEKFMMFPLFFAVVAALFTYGARTSFTVLTGILVPLLLLVFSFREKSLILQFDNEGISIIWSSIGSTHRSKPIPWQAVQFVSLFESKTKKKLELCLNRSHPAAAHLGLLQYLFAAIFRKNKKDLVVSFDLDGFKEMQDKQHVLAAINRFVSREQIDNAVANTLNPTDPESYTKLWLESLGNDSKVRRFEGKLSAGQQLSNGKFEIVEFIGAGGQASVYLAKDKSNDDKSRMSATSYECPHVILKEFVLPSHAGADLSKRSLEHIDRELRLMKKLEHPNIVQYHDIFVEDHRCYLVLEHVKGKSLRALVEDSGPLSQEQVLQLARQMTQILSHLHGQVPPVVHRDFTPENLILDESGVLKLIDFNVAQELEEGSTKTIVGKHSYLPPEQFRGRACPQSDIYAFGATLFFMLTGEEPEPISCSHPILKDESVSPQINAIVARATELELSERYQNANDIFKDLESY